MAQSAQLALALDETPTTVTPEDFDRAALEHVHHPYGRTSTYLVWDLDSIRSARDDHMRGIFTRSARMAEAMKTEPAIYSALLNRIAPPRGLPRQFTTAGKRLEAEAMATFGAKGTALASLPDMHERLAMLGLSVSQVIWTAREDGSRLNARLAPWPMHAVRWEEASQELWAQTTEGYKPIRHGDGKWCVFSLHQSRPWEWGAVKPLSGLWPDLSFGRRDRSQHSETQGQAKWIGILPEGVPMNDVRAKAFTEAVKGLRRGRSGLTAPHGSAVKMEESQNQAWQIFRELITGDTKDVDRVLLGQDGTLTKEGGNYIQAAELHNVRYDIVEGDLGAIDGGVSHGLLRPWSIVNIGRGDAISDMHHVLPDVDEDARRQSVATRTKSFAEALGLLLQAGAELSQDYVDALAAQYDVLAPTIGPPPAPPTPEPPAEPDDEDEQP